MIRSTKFGKLILYENVIQGWNYSITKPFYKVRNDILLYENLIRGFKFTVQNIWLGCSSNIYLQQTSSFGTLNVYVPIILSHLQDYVPYNVRYVWSFCWPVLLVVDARSLGFRRKCCKKFYNTLCLLIIFKNDMDTFILSSNVIIDLINV